LDQEAAALLDGGGEQPIGFMQEGNNSLPVIEVGSELGNACMSTFNSPVNDGADQINAPTRTSTVTVGVNYSLPPGDVQQAASSVSSIVAEDAKGRTMVATKAPAPVQEPPNR